MAGRKLLFYTHGLTGGGAERVWAVIASRFAEAGDEVLFAVDRTADENRGFLDPSVRLITLDKGHAGAVFALSSLLRREQPDVLLSAIGVSNLKLFLAALLAGRLKSTIVSIHGYFHSEGQPLSQIGNLSMPIISRMTGATIAVSDGLRRHVIARWRLPAAKVRRIYNPVIVTMPEAPPTADSLGGRDPVILAVGRLVSYKAYPVLLEAFAKVRTADARLLILGEGPERGLIEEQIRALGLGARVTLLGYHPEPWRFYAMARCFVLPSMSEAFGNVVVEALANGLPIVATHCHGPEEILDRSGLGTLVPIGDAGVMATAIDAALRAPGDPGPRVARAQDFNSDTAFEAYDRLIGEVIGAR